jgi:hypothetical protein
MSLAKSTLLLATDTWDLVLDASGNIAVADPPYALAQDVASAIRTFLGEVYWDTTIGVPYQTQILGHTPPITYFKEQMVAAALTVPGVVTATCTISSFVGRKITGQVLFTDDTGITGAVGLAPPPPILPPLGIAWTADSTVVTADSANFTADG